LLQPGQPVLHLPIVEATTTIGAGASNTVRLTDDEAAETHARIDRGGLIHTLTRLANPLLVNGKRVRQAVLRPGDLITIGRSALMFQSGVPPTGTDATEPDRAVEICRRLYQFGRALSREQPAEALSAQMLSDLLALTGAERGRLVLLDEQRPHTAAAEAVSAGDWQPDEQQLSRTVLARIFEDPRPLLFGDVRSDDDLRHAPSLLQASVRALMCAPIRVEDRLVGALYLSSSTPQSRFSEEALDLLTLYANQAALLVVQMKKACSLVARAEAAETKLDALRSRTVVGSSPALRALFADVGKVARTDLSVLFSGETGTGKELLAHEVHRLSARAQAPFIAVHCGAIPEALLESELFGHVRGAYTGASQDRAGKVRSADGGTLFLDEIGDMPLGQQVKLLRVLQDGRVTPVGGDHSLEVDFRLVCASNLDLEARVAEGAFRSDLYFRIAGVTLRVPALRERGDDAVELAQHFVHRHRILLDRPQARLSARALTAIRTHRWPGNVRELEAAIRRGIVLADGDAVEPANLGLEEPAASANTPFVLPLSQVRDEYLKDYVRSVVERLGGNRLEAAKALMVSPRTIYKYLEEV
jgi:transcriptional regulator with GAF, ATPase, and Fis domain